MIVFLDTSALVKLYIVETGSQALFSRIEKGSRSSILRRHRVPDPQTSAATPPARVRA